MFKWYMKMGLFGKVFLPFVLLLPLGLGMPVKYISEATHKNMVEATVRNAQTAINQFKLVRKYYTDNVIAKVKAAGVMKIDFAHNGKADTIPLPATFVHDISEIFQNEKIGTKLHLYSKFPFPNRKDRVLDEYQKSAIEELTKNPEQPYVRAYLDEGKERVRVAVADKMVAETCVGCHNSRPDSPFTQWKLGDVRGILEIDTPISEDVKATAAMIATVGWFSSGTGVAVLCVLVLVMVAFVSRPLKRATQSLRLMKKAADDTFSSSKEVNNASSEVASQTTEQASAIQETVATLDEISTMVTRGVEGASRTTNLAMESHRVATQGKKAVEEVILAMDDINKSNEVIIGEIEESNQKIAEIISVIKEIGEKTKVINDIVFQTRLLSFNASVEAARAGEHGKGFAVVAEEVGNLAQMSGNAAKEIADMLGASIGKVDSIVQTTKSNVARMVTSGKTKVEAGVDVAKRCGEILDRVVQNVNQVNDMMSEITSASKEQAEGVTNITTAMNELDTTTHSNAAVAEKTAHYSDNLARQAGIIRDHVAQLEKDLLGAQASNQRVNGKNHPEEQPNVVALDPQKPTSKREPSHARETLNQNYGKRVSGSDVAPSEGDRGSK